MIMERSNHNNNMNDESSWRFLQSNHQDDPNDKKIRVSNDANNTMMMEAAGNDVTPVNGMGWMDASSSGVVAGAEAAAGAASASAPPRTEVEEEAETAAGGGGGGGNLRFPLQLYQLLEDAEREGFSHVISWMPCGSAIKVHSPKKFECEGIMARYFKNQSRYKSFQKQLSIYQFSRATRGAEKGAYSHPLFLRGRKDLCSKITRPKVGTGTTTTTTTSTAMDSPTTSTSSGTGVVVTSSTTPLTSNNIVGGGRMRFHRTREEFKQQQMNDLDSTTAAHHHSLRPGAAVPYNLFSEASSAPTLQCNTTTAAATTTGNSTTTEIQRLQRQDAAAASSSSSSSLYMNSMRTMMNETSDDIMNEIILTFVGGGTGN